MSSPLPAETRDESQNVRLADTSRVEAFSDGVFAIVITLLVLDLRLPAHQPGELLHALGRLWPSYLAFAASFLYVGVIWLNHHQLFLRIARMRVGLNWINLAVLLGAVLIPFPTAVLSEAFGGAGTRSDQRAAVVLYALVALAMSATWGVMFAYLRRHPSLLEDDTSPQWAKRQLSRPVTGVIVYGLGALGALITPVLGLVAIVGMIGYHALTSEGVRRLIGGAR